MSAVAQIPPLDNAIAAAPLPGRGQRPLLRFITCGSVDDGKSTLIGRILYEAGAVFDDHLDALDRDSSRFGTTGEDRDFALLVDGLAAEREQGITIDVAYRYFSTPKRNFIVADTPGHEQYTRNMATGASTADLAVLLIDARKGLLPQTRRHSFIVSMVGVRHVIVAVNKMDLVGYDEARFRAIEADYRAAVAGLGFAGITCVPVSARQGDNLTTHSLKMPWFRGQPLLTLLETIETGGAGADTAAFAMPVQWVNRPNAEFRGFSGTVATGRIGVGEAIVALPSRTTSRIARIVTADGDLETAGRGQAVTLVLADEIDLSRGDVITGGHGARAGARPRVRQELDARLIVTGERVITPGSSFVLKLGTALANATVTWIDHAVDIERFEEAATASLGLNAIARVGLRIDRPLVVLDYEESHELGGFILIDRTTNETSAFGFVARESAAGGRQGAEAGGLRQVFDRAFGIAGSQMRRQRLVRLSWRMVSALLVAGLALVLGGGMVVAIGAGLADLTLRPLARAAHDRVLDRLLSRRDTMLAVDGDGI
mgnify:CR=1 FL=1